MCLFCKHLNFQGFLGSLQILLAGCQSVVPSVYLPTDSLQVVLVCQLITAEGVEYPHRGFRCTGWSFQKLWCPNNIEAAIIGKLPIVGIAWTVYLLLCEFKSIREKAYEKAEIRKQDRTMQVILENKDEIAKAVVEIMKEERKKGGDNEDN